jgi:hypothetical protein
MLLTRAIVRGVPSAINMAKSLIENPAIVSQTPPFAISLEVEDYGKHASAEVSQRPVIVPGTGVKQFLNDNVAPSPKEWTLSGYIPGDNLVEQTCLFTPIVRANVDFLWLAFDLGSRIIFKDQDQKIYNNCVISDLETRPNKECKNKMPFTMTIKEIKTIESTMTELTETEKNALPTNEDVGMGTTGTTKVPEGALYNPLGGDAVAAKFAQ